MQRLLYFTLLFGSLACPALAQSHKAVAYFQEAERLFEQKKNNEALDLLGKAIADSPNYQEAILKRATHFRDSQKIEDALQDFSALIQLVPTHIPYRLARGSMLQDAKNFDEAETDYLKAYQTDSTNLDVLLALGDLYKDAELYEDAILFLNKGLKIDDKNFNLHITRAQVFQNSKQYQKALDEIKICEAQKPTDEFVWRCKALCYVRLQKQDEAIAIYNTQKQKKTRFLEEDFLFWGTAYYDKQDYKNAKDILAYPEKPQHPELYHMAGKALFKLNDYPNAIRKIDSAIVLFNEFSEIELAAPAYYNRAYINHKANKPRQAQDDLTQAIRLTPELVNGQDYEGTPVPLLGNAIEALKINKFVLDTLRILGHHERAEALILSGESNRAWAELKKCEAIDSTHSKTALLRAKVSLLIGKFEDAFESLKEAEKRKKGRSEEQIAYLRAITYQEKGEYAEAKKYLAIALAKNQTDTDYYSLLGSIEFESANNKGALEAVNKAISMQPQNMNYYIERAIYLQALSKPQEAINDCNKVLETENDNPEALIQRGLAYKTLKKYKEALADFQKAQQYDPKDKDLKDLIEEVKNK